MNRRFLLLCIAVIWYQAADAMDERSAYPEKIVVWEGGIHFGWTRIILKPDGRIYGSAINRERHAGSRSLSTGLSANLCPRGPLNFIIARPPR